MKKITCIQVIVTIFFSLNLMGCGVTSISPASGNNIPIRATSPIPVPIVSLEYAGQSISSIESFYNLDVGNGSFSGEGAIPGNSSATLLQSTVGTNVEIVVTYSTPPVALSIIELDQNGKPQIANALMTAGYRTKYKLINKGKYQLQITVEWTYKNYVRSLFDVNIQP